MNLFADPVLVAYRNRLPITDRLHVVQVSIAEAAAELVWLREHQADYEDEDLLDEARAITRRIRGLRRLVEVDVAEHRVVAPTGIDPSSRTGQQVLGLLLDKISGIAHEVLPEPAAAELEGRFRADLEADPEIPWAPLPTPPDEPPPSDGPPPDAAE